MPSGDVLHEGDNFKLKLPENATIGNWGYENSEFENFPDASLGKWRIHDGYIEVILGSSAEGTNSMTASLLTGKRALINTTFKNITQNVTLGDISKLIKFNAPTLLPLHPDQKIAYTTSNSVIHWITHINNDGPYELSQNTLGENFTIKNNTYFEDTISERGTFIGNPEINAILRFPVDLTSGVPSSANRLYSVTSYFNKVEQNSGEPYDDFKSRLKALEWGIYQNQDNGIQTVIINFGNIGDNGLKYELIKPGFVSEAVLWATDQGFYDESEKDLLTDYLSNVYGNNNIINGGVANYTVHLKVNYDKVILDTAKINNAIVTMNNTSGTLTGKGILQWNMSNTAVTKNTAGLFLYDEDTNELLPNATFRLQYNNAGVWEDYLPANTMTTNLEGFIQTPTLGSGTYRFVQLTASTDEYDLVNSKGYNTTINKVVSDEFTITPADTEGIKLPVSNVRFKLSVTYKKGDQGIFDDEVHEKIFINSPTPSFSGQKDSKGLPLGKTGYEFIGWDKTISNKVTENTIYTAQWKAINYPIEYVLDGGTNSELNPESYEYGIGVNSFSDATKVGYKFIGWYDSEIDGNLFTTISTTEYGTKTLYARWEKDTSNVPLPTEEDKDKTEDINNDYNGIRDNIKSQKTLPSTGGDIYILYLGILLITSGIYFLRTIHKRN